MFVYVAIWVVNFLDIGPSIMMIIFYRGYVLKVKKEIRVRESRWVRLEVVKIAVIFDKLFTSNLFFDNYGHSIMVRLLIKGEVGYSISPELLKLYNWSKLRY